MPEVDEGFKQMLFSALARKGLRGQGASAFLKGGSEQKSVNLVKTPTNLQPIDNRNDHQTGAGVTASWWVGGHKTQAGRPPGKTGVSALQWYRREVGPVQCSATVKTGHREVQPVARRCSRKAAAGRLTCSTHGATGRNRGSLAELRPEDVPTLVGDR